jgi:leucyl aminopeptidase
MNPTTQPTGLTCVTMPFAAVDVEVLVVPWFENEGPATTPGLDAAVSGEVSRALSQKEFTAAAYEVFLTGFTDGSWKARRLLLIGGGQRATFGSDRGRKLAAAAGLWAKQRHLQRVGFVVPDKVPVDPAELAQSVSEGLTLAEFDPGQYKTANHEPSPAPAWTIVAAEGIPLSDVSTAAARGRVLGECSNLARSLANEPGNVLTPREFAARISGLAAVDGVRIDVLEDQDLARLEMGLLLGVARGSSEPPRMIVLRYTPAAAPSAPVLGLIGKGITFDTGGISIKPADGMERMKDDMAGGAAVACAIRAIASLGAQRQVVGVVPATENMPGGRAIKPGDVLRSASGKTVEVINTDAEGRLILGDALWYARQLGATHLVDVATLTGACVVALGKITTGLFGDPPEWVDHVRKVANRAGDRVWPMPLFEEYRDQLKSDIADLSNTGGRPAGSITAALFLNEFTGGLPWAHLDIAGTAWAEEAKPYLPKGPSGVAVRTLAELAFTDFP